MIAAEQWIDSSKEKPQQKKALIGINVLSENPDSYNNKLKRSVNDSYLIDKFNWLNINPGFIYYYVQNAQSFLLQYPFQFVSIIYSDSHEEVKQFMKEINSHYNQ